MPGCKRRLDRFQLLRVFDHHIDEIFGVPEGIQNRFGLRFPVRIGRFAKLVGGSGLYDSRILEVWRIVFSADLFDQRKRRLNRVLKEKTPYSTRGKSGRRRPPRPLPGHGLILPTPAAGT